MRSSSRRDAFSEDFKCTVQLYESEYKKARKIRRTKRLTASRILFKRKVFLQRVKLIEKIGYPMYNFFLFSYKLELIENRILLMFSKFYVSKFY